MNKKKNNDIKKILKEVFSKSKIPQNITKLKLGDLKEWDSLGNFNFLLAVEDEFHIKFSIKESCLYQSL